MGGLLPPPLPVRSSLLGTDQTRKLQGLLAPRCWLTVPCGFSLALYPNPGNLANMPLDPLSPRGGGLGVGCVASTYGVAQV